MIRAFVRTGFAGLLLLILATAASRAQEPSPPPPLAQTSPAAATPAATTSAMATATQEGSAPPAAPLEPKLSWSSVRVNGPYIAMTFDDGPSAKLTPELLDILAQRHMHVTFFVVGTNAAAHPEILRRAVAEGHEVGNHSWDHPDFARKSEEEVRSQLDRTQDAIKVALGHPPTLFRPPYGSLTKDQKKWISRDYGYKIILWSVDPLDWRRPGPEIIHHRIVDATHPGAIILSHDIHPGTIEAMPATFDDLLAKGYKFVTVSELLAMELPPEPKRVHAHAPAPASSAEPEESATPTPARTPAGPPMPEKITGSPQ
jgi:peptidoglycan/xylan/chitin deacetylase (PgdA/CDA1 family)